LGLAKIVEICFRDNVHSDNCNLLRPFSWEEERGGLLRTSREDDQFVS